MNKKTRSPLFHITKRDALPWYKSWAAICLRHQGSIITTTMTGEIRQIGSFAVQRSGVVAEYRDVSDAPARNAADAAWNGGWC